MPPVLNIIDAFQVQGSPDFNKYLLNFFTQTPFFKRLKCNNNPSYYIHKMIECIQLVNFKKNKVVYSSDSQISQKLLFVGKGQCLQLTYPRQGSFIEWQKKIRDIQKFILQSKQQLIISPSNMQHQVNHQLQQQQQLLQIQKSQSNPNMLLNPIQSDPSVSQDLMNKIKSLQLSMAILERGDHIGDLQMLQQPDLDNVSTERQIVLALSEDTAILSLSYPQFLEIFENLIYQNKFLMQYLMSLFPKIEREKIKYLASLFAQYEIPEEQVIIREKQENRTLYMIREGSVNILQYSIAKSREMQINTLKQGDIFGFESLKKDQVIGGLNYKSDFMYVAAQGTQTVNPQLYASPSSNPQNPQISFIGTNLKQSNLFGGSMSSSTLMSNANQRNNQFQESNRIWVYACDLQSAVTILRKELLNLAEERNSWYQGKVALHERTLDICNQSKQKKIILMEHLQKSVSSSNILDTSSSYEFFSRIPIDNKHIGGSNSIINQYGIKQINLPGILSSEPQLVMNQGSKTDMFDKKSFLSGTHRRQASSTNDLSNLEQFIQPISLNKDYKNFQPLPGDTLNLYSLTPIQNHLVRKRMNMAKKPDYGSQPRLPNVLSQNNSNLDATNSTSFQNENKSVMMAGENQQNKKSNLLKENSGINSVQMEELLKQNKIFSFKDELQFQLFKAIENSYFKQIKIGQQVQFNNEIVSNQQTPSNKMFSRQQQSKDQFTSDNVNQNNHYMKIEENTDGEIFNINQEQFINNLKQNNQPKSRENNYTQDKNIHTDVNNNNKNDHQSPERFVVQQVPQNIANANSQKNSPQKFQTNRRNKQDHILEY